MRKCFKWGLCNIAMSIILWSTDQNVQRLGIFLLLCLRFCFSFLGKMKSCLSLYCVNVFHVLYFRKPPRPQKKTQFASSFNELKQVHRGTRTNSSRRSSSEGRHGEAQ